MAGPYYRCCPSYFLCSIFRTDLASWLGSPGMPWRGPGERRARSSPVSAVRFKIMRRQFLKSIFDRLVAGLALLLASPLLILTAIAIAVDDGLPILFRQPRVGRDGKVFPLL